MPSLQINTGKVPVLDESDRGRSKNTKRIDKVYKQKHKADEWFWQFITKNLIIELKGSDGMADQ
ncbi:hypothetical protein [uncultured Desulfobacter sp.]|uniref:hypothetical protein n=1 Tax=uncultured Desulfobacter sp. TaxID=240139 RepID=UPI003748F96A